MSEFNISKDTITKIKIISQLNQSAILKRNIFIKSEDSAAIFSTTLKDFPDDFKFKVFDITGFASILSLFKNGSTLNYKNFEKTNQITVSDSKNKKERFKINKDELSKYDLDIDPSKEDDMNKKLGDKINIFKMNKDVLKNILKSARIIEANGLKITCREGDDVKLKLYNTKLPNSRIYEMNIESDTIVSEYNLHFLLQVEKLQLLDLSTDYTVNLFDTGEGNKTLVKFINEEMKFYFTKMKE